MYTRSNAFLRSRNNEANLLFLSKFDLIKL